MRAWPYKYVCIRTTDPELRQLGDQFSHGTYLVYREVWAGEKLRCTLAEAIATHWQAIFVLESEAALFCKHMNKHPKL